ncbi:hypothetical protein RIF29_35312 [Crotalaria pallida]|uniref:Uncharacterized protein n=1 Tax=Crotalaria pallida TaxID=3830 RepID=A0AAN9EA03_CROPI
MGKIKQMMNHYGNERIKKETYCYGAYIFFSEHVMVGLKGKLLINQTESLSCPLMHEQINTYLRGALYVFGEEIFGGQRTLILLAMFEKFLIELSAFLGRSMEKRFILLFLLHNLISLKMKPKQGLKLMELSQVLIASDLYNILLFSFPRIRI